MRRLAIALLLLAACGQSPEGSPPDASASASASGSAKPSAPVPDHPGRARELAKKLIILDGHVDLPYRLYELKKRGKPLDDVSQPSPDGQFDHPRAVAGGLDAPFMSIYVPADYQEKGGAKALADELIDMVEAIVRQAPDKFAIARSPEDVRANSAAGKISLPLGIENGAAIEGKLDNLAHFHGRGVRYITLTHSKDNDICDSSYDTRHSHKGLSPFGREVVAEMNRLGIMIDVSHVTDDAARQAIELSDVPVIASHSSCRAYTPGFERNMSDELIQLLAKKGGVIQINFGSSFIDAHALRVRDRGWEAAAAFAKDRGLERGAPEVEAFEKAWDRDNRPPFATVEQVADHIDHVVKLVGIDHVGLGSDFDGVGDSLPTGLKDVAGFPNLFRVLLARGYSEAQLEKIASGNVLRVWAAVEARGANAR